MKPQPQPQNASGPWVTSEADRNQEALRRVRSAERSVELGENIALPLASSRPAPNAFSRPAQSIASKFTQQRVSKTVERNPRYLGYLIVSGAQAQASHTKSQRILKGALR